MIAVKGNWHNCSEILMNKMSDDSERNDHRRKGIQRMKMKRRGRTRDCRGDSCHKDE